MNAEQVEALLDRLSPGGFRQQVKELEAAARAAEQARAAMPALPEPARMEPVQDESKIPEENPVLENLIAIRSALAERQALAETPAAEQFLPFTTKQRLLLSALHEKGDVSLDRVLRAVYGSASRDKLQTFDRLVSRTNEALTKKDKRLEVKKKGDTYRLSPI